MRMFIIHYFNNLTCFCSSCTIKAKTISQAENRFEKRFSDCIISQISEILPTGAAI